MRTSHGAPPKRSSISVHRRLPAYCTEKRCCREMRATLLRRLEQGDASREAVHEIVLADGAQFPRREEAGERDFAERLFHGCSVVVRLAEEAGAAAVAGE